MHYNHLHRDVKQVSTPPLSPFTLVQHNCLGSWDVFLSWFGSFSQLTAALSVVALQDPPVYRGKLPSFKLYTCFSPPSGNSGKPHVAFYVFSNFLATITLLPKFFGRNDVIGLEHFTPSGFFDPWIVGFTMVNSYSNKV